MNRASGASGGGRVGACVVAMAAGMAIGAEVPHAGMMRFPDVSRTHIVFSYANDLWLVAREGGDARPLSSPPGPEMFARFSPDGGTIAFMGNYDGGMDLYTIPSSGGVPERVTHHSAQELLADWTSDGRLTFAAMNLSGTARQPRLYAVDADGGMPEPLPVPYGLAGTIDPTGEWLAYTPTNRDFRTWKRYAGGLASDIWLFNLRDMSSRRVTDWKGTDTTPMWHGGTLYYLSDAGPELRLNLWSWDPSTGARTQLTRFGGNDVKFPAMGPGPKGGGEIVFQLGAELRLYDIPTGTSRAVTVSIPGDRPTIRPRTVNAMEHLAGGDVGATGKRIVLEARGDLWTVPVENGTPRQLTSTSGVAERYPAWSPDGRWIAYFSDETGEYELCVTQSDGRGETRRLTEGSRTYYANPVWSPDSKHILYSDKSGRLLLTTVEDGATREVARDPWVMDWSGGIAGSWSPDSRWIAYHLHTEQNMMASVIMIYDVENDEHHRVTSGFYSDMNPVFGRDGEWLYFASTRDFTSPKYEDVGTTFIYDATMRLIAVPLTAAVGDPFAPEVDEETWEEEKDEDEAASDEAGGDDGDDGDEAEPDRSPIHGVWSGKATGLSKIPGAPDELEFTMEIVDNGDGTFSGESTGQGQTNAYDTVTFDAASGRLTATREEGPISQRITGTLSGDSLSGEWSIRIAAAGIDATGPWTAERTEGEPSLEGDEDGGSKRDADDPVEIDLEGFEARSIELPVAAGRFGGLASNDRGHLLYLRADPGTAPSVKIFDINDDEPSEKTVVAGAGGFMVSGDGKKLGVMGLDGRMSVVDASPGQSMSPIDVGMLRKRVEPREEWRQILRDAWRRHRDYFYVENMHGVDWDAVWRNAEAMLEHAASREDVSYIIGDMIGELNVGHAYYWGGDTEDAPSESVGLLGADLAPAPLAGEIDAEHAAAAEEALGRPLPAEAYRISRILRGAAWDTAARSPLARAGLGVSEGDFILAINGAELTTDTDPWAALVGLAGRIVELTILDATPEPAGDDAGGADGAEDGDAEEAEDGPVRHVLVRAVGSDAALRYRDWVETNRATVEAMSGGRVGYIHVPNTGVDGQNELFRQFYGQAGKEALIIDERWNGGGQIPTRFIELLNRPRTNYWARRDGRDWPWPYDSHQGPKAMLINGNAGSGGDMFPWLFRHNQLGKLIGRRTWGGLVGITTMPGLIDGGYTAVPTFGFYETDGTWGIEGHGVDPDIEVIDDPALMVDGGDPQLDAAVRHLLEELGRTPYVAPAPPAAPDRRGIGIEPADR